MTALADVSLSIDEGAFVTVVGTSGSGKSTFLRICAGLEKPSAGKLIDYGKENGGRVGFVFQGESVFPWRTVERNLTYSLEARSEPPEVRKEAARHLCSRVGLEPERFLDKYPRELSGGELRRVAIGMALSVNASMLLLDEATSQLDYWNRRALQSVISDLWQKTRPTVIYVTHDLEEAILMGTEIIALRFGRMAERVTVDLPFPRTQDSLSSLSAVTVRNRILDVFSGRA